MKKLWVKKAFLGLIISCGWQASAGADPSASDESAPAEEVDHTEVDESAQDPEPKKVSPTKKPKKKKTGPSQYSTRAIRSRSTIWAGFSPVEAGLIIPGKYSLGAGLTIGSDLDVFAEYSWAELGFKVLDIDLYKFTEKVYTANLRWYMGTNSFYTRYGLGKRAYRLVIGDEDLEELNPTDQPIAIEALTSENYILSLGLGNRWSFQPRPLWSWFIGIDWLVIHIPIGGGETDDKLLDYTSGTDTEESLREILSLLQYTPTFSIKLEFGFSI